jgi:putative FmdB family regulatory protein
MPLYVMQCEECGHELEIFRKVARIDEDLPECCGHVMQRKIVAPAVQADLAAYQAVAPDVKLGGRAPHIEGRKEHREYLKRNGYVEVGNDISTKPREQPGDFNVRKELTEATREVLARQR